MTNTTPGGAAATLARTKRIEIQHFADGGTVRRTTVRDFGKPGSAAAQLAQVPASHAGAKNIEHGGPVKGPGGPTSDSVPLWGSAGEFMLPADTTAAVGKDQLQALVDATHTPTKSAGEKMGRLARADGGLVDPGAVTRVGNSYSGGDVGGSITVNGQAPGGTVSTTDAFRTPPTPPAAALLGAPSSMMPVFPKPAVPAAAPAAPVAPAQTSMAAPGVGPLDYANRNAAFNAAAQERTAALARPGAPLRTATPPAAPAVPSAPPPPVSAADTLTRRPVQSVVGYADGGEIEDPRKQVPAFASADMAAQALASMAANARNDMQNAAGVKLASLSPRAAAASAAPQSYVAEIPRGRYESAAAFPAPAPATAPAAEAAAPVAASAAALVAPPAAVTAAPVVESAAVPVQSAQARLGAVPMPAAAASARANLLGGLADTNAQLASLQASNAAVPQGGATIIDNAASEADRRAQFNEQANLSNALARTSWSPRQGTQVNDAAVAATMAPIDARARMAQVAAKEAGDTQRATIQERGADARARLADTRAQQAIGVDQQRLGLEGQRVALDASRDERAAAAAEPALALAQRKASLQAVVADASSTPAQRQAAAQQIAGMEGKELLGHAAPAGYERTADGNLRFIKGGPADPDTPKGKNNLTDTQGKALQFGSRMQEANAIFDDLASKGKLFSTVGANNAVTGAVVNQFNSAEAQQLDQAKRNFLNAVLRRESGAVISDAEFENGAKQYFPAVGDSEEVIKQKRENRLLSTRGILAEVPDSERRVADVRGTAPPPAKVNSAADVAALPSGATFVGPDGKTRRKL